MRNFIPSLLLLFASCNEPLFRFKEEATLTWSICIVLELDSGERYEITNLDDFVDPSSLHLPQTVRVSYDEVNSASFCMVGRGFVELCSLELED